jgi:hypothetical protein
MTCGTGPASRSGRDLTERLTSALVSFFFTGVSAHMRRSFRLPLVALEKSADGAFCPAGPLAGDQFEVVFSGS